MIGRKLVMLHNGQALERKEILLKFPYLEEWKQVTVKKIKIVGHISLVEIIRFHIRSSNLLKNKYQEAKDKIKNIRNKNSNISEDKKEVSKFLKMISEYKQKIRKIKHKIKKEEENL